MSAGGRRGEVSRALRRSPYDREIVRLALPALGALAADPLVSLVDTAYVGRLGTDALGALAVAAAVFGVAFSVFNFLSYGTTSLVARAVGRGDAAAAGRYATTAVGAAAVLGVVAAVVLLVAPHPLLRTLGAGDDLLAPSVAYLRIRALALPAVLLIAAGHGIFRGAQDTKTPFLIALGLNAVNLVLDPLLIFGAGLGLEGAAIATVVAQWLGAIVFAFVLRRRHTEMGISTAPPGWAEARELGSAGRNLILRTAGLLVAFTASTAVAARMGAVQVAAHQVALQLFIFLSLVLDAIAIAAQAMLGKAVGGADPALVRRLADRMVVLGTESGTFLGVVLLAVSPWLPWLFTTDPAVVASLQTLFVPLVLIQVVGGAVFAWDGIVIGAGDFAYAMKGALFPALISTLLYLPILPLGLGLAAVWWVIVVMMVLRAGWMAWWHRTRLPLLIA